MLRSALNNARDRLAKRRRFNQMTAEIMNLTDRDLADFNGNRSEMLHHARMEVYGG